MSTTSPTAENTTVTTSEDTGYVFKVGDFSFSDADVGDTLKSVQITLPPSLGTLRFKGTNVAQNQTISIDDINAGYLVYTSLVDGSGTSYSSFTYKVSDGVNLSNQVTMTIDVSTVNDSPTFNVGTGKVTTAIGNSVDMAISVAVQADGKIVAGGYTVKNSGDYDVAVVRYNTDGSLDTTFSVAGKAVVDLGSVSDEAWSLAVQADGKIVVAGEANINSVDFGLARLNSDGTLDTSFSADGKVTTDIGSRGDASRSVTVQADGKIVASGHSNNGSNDDFAIVRYNSDGSLDTTFGLGGKVTTAIGSNTERAYSVAAQTDGKLVVAGYSNNGSNDTFALVRYNTDGSLDTTFGSGGKVTTAIAGEARSVAVQADGKILVAGTSRTTGLPDFTLVRYNSDGSLDATFGSGGKITTAIGSKTDRAYSVALQADGKIMVAGESDIDSDYDVALVRYNSDGTIDAAFGAGGKVTTAIGGSTDRAYSVTVQADGKTVVAGFSWNGSNYDFAVVRYNIDGSLDTTFNPANTLDGTPTYTEDGSPVVLDANVILTDAELSAQGHYGGSTLTLARQSGANAQDVFSATGTLSFAGGNVVVDGTAIGTLTNGDGTLAITFNSNATQALVNSALQKIGYSNSSDLPPASVQIGWSFNDGSGAGNGVVSGATEITVIATNDAPLNTVPNTQTLIRNGEVLLSAANSNAISLSDGDLNGGNIRITLSVTSGVLELKTVPAGVQLIDGAYVGAASMTFEGSLATINSALASGVAYTPSNGFTGVDTLQVITSDLGSSGPGGTKTDVDSITLKVLQPGPTVTAVQASAMNGTYKIGDVLSFTVTFDQAVTVDTANGMPALQLETGSIDRTATYTSGSGTHTLTFAYTVQSGDVSADLDYQSTAALVLNNATIRNVDSQNAILALPALGNSSVAGQHAIAIDGVVPTITSVAVPANGTYTVEQTLDFAVAWSENVTVDTSAGTPSLPVTLDTGGTVYASYVSGSGTNTLVMRLTVTTGMVDLTGIAVGNTIVLNGSEIRDAVGNDASLGLNGIAATSGVRVNTTVPSVPPSNPNPVTPSEPVPESTLIDGVRVQITTVVNADGSTSQKIVVPVITALSTDENGNSMADIPLVKTASGTSLLTAQLPVGYGLEVIGSPAPKVAGSSFADLTRSLNAHTSAGSPDQTRLAKEGSDFLSALPTSIPLLVVSIVPTIDSGTAPGQPLVITGMPATPGSPVTALVIDSRGLPNGTHLQLDNVEFAALIGSVKVTGGAGSQNIRGDGASQYIVLGADDDVLHGGAGDDTVGSAGGNDKIFGDEGNDFVFGGLGNDVIDGGSGTDTMRLLGSSRADYTMRAENGKLTIAHRNGGTDSTDTVAAVEKLNFTGPDMTPAGMISRMYDAMFDRAADQVGLNYWVKMHAVGLSMRDIANQLVHSVEAAKLHGVQSNAQFIDTLYQSAFGRTADGNGRSYWIDVLDKSKADRADVIFAFANSEEKLAQEKGVGYTIDFSSTDVATLVRMYDTLFDRKPDLAGINHWIQVSESGMALRDIGWNFVQGSEVQFSAMSNRQFVEYLYKTGLERRGSEAEVSAWVSQLDSGAIHRGDALLGFADSAEKIALVGTINTSIETL